MTSLSSSLSIKAEFLKKSKTDSLSGRDPDPEAPRVWGTVVTISMNAKTIANENFKLVLIMDTDNDTFLILHIFPKTNHCVGWGVP